MKPCCLSSSSWRYAILCDATRPVQVFAAQHATGDVAGALSIQEGLVCRSCRTTSVEQPTSCHPARLSLTQVEHLRTRGAAQGSRPRPQGLSAPQLPQPLPPLGSAAPGWDADKLLPRTPDIAERGFAGLRAPPAELFSHAPDAAATLRVSVREAGLGAATEPASGSAGGCCDGAASLWAGSGGSLSAVEGQLSAWPAWSGVQAGARVFFLGSTV